jgi:aminoglycoside phosphotransferase (APT) family kinase protein
LMTMADVLGRHDRVLVHGDVSPKNILFRDYRPVLLDAECATMGDGAFDVAFCLNHLALKAIHLPGSRARLVQPICAFWAAYRPHLAWEDPAAFEARVARLLPMLMLARVDGKSPVEYLTPAGQAKARALARELISRPVAQVSAIVAVLAGDAP